MMPRLMDGEQRISIVNATRRDGRLLSSKQPRVSSLVASQQQNGNPHPEEISLSPAPHSFLFSVNEGSKYSITSGDARAIECYIGWCAVFGWGELYIVSDSNNNTDSYCLANSYNYKLPAAEGSQYPSINGGDYNF
jgi:hypothetical protein